MAFQEVERAKGSVSRVRESLFPIGLKPRIWLRLHVTTQESAVLRTRHPAVPSGGPRTVQSRQVPGSSCSGASG